MTKNQRLNASITIGSVIDQSVRRNIGFLKSGLSSVGDEIKGVERKQRELDRQRHVLRRQGQSVEALDREYEDLSRTLGDLRRQQERWNRVAGASRRVGASFSGMVTQVGRSARTVAVGVGLAGGAVFGLASSTAQLGDDVAKTADKLGVGIAELQELRYAAERSGVATSAFDKSLEKMVKNLGEAAGGTGEAKGAFEALGLSAADLVSMSPDEALELIAERMQGVATQSERAALANDIFGRSGIGMLNMLRDGSKGLQDLRDDARRTGYVLSEQAARDAEVFQDTLLDTQLVMKGLKNTVGAELMPVVTQGMRRVGDALIENRAQVQVWATAFAGGVERAIPIIGDVAIGLGNVLKVTGSVIGTTAEMVGGWENFGMILGAVFAAKTVVSIGKFAGSVFGLGRAMFSLVRATPLVTGGIRAVGVALTTTPIGLAVTAIAGAAYLIYKNWGAVGDWFRALWDTVGTSFSGAAGLIAGIITGDMTRAGDGLRTLWDGTLGTVGLLWDGLGSTVKAIWTDMIKPINDALGITDPIVDAWNAADIALGNVLSSIGENFTWVGDLIDPIIDGLKWVQEKGGSILSDLRAPFSGNVAPGPQSPQPRTIPSPGQDRGVRIPVRKNARGGPFGVGWHFTGEEGPEMKFESRAGYVANNRQLRQLAAYSDKAASADAMSHGQSHAPAAGPSVVQQITNHIAANGVSAEELFALLERRNRRQAQSVMFDSDPAVAGFGG